MESLVSKIRGGVAFVGHMVIAVFIAIVMRNEDSGSSSDYWDH